MNPSIANFLTAFGIAALAALGGAAIVFSEFDDAPGGVLIGMLFIIGAVLLGWKRLQRGDGGRLGSGG